MTLYCVRQRTTRSVRSSVYLSLCSRLSEDEEPDNNKKKCIWNEGNTARKHLKLKERRYKLLGVA